MAITEQPEEHFEEIKLRAAVVIRVSTEDQLLGYGPEEQRQRCLEKISKLNGVPVREYVIAESAAKLFRPQFEGIVTKLEQLRRDGQIDFVVFDRVDRLTRGNVYDFGVYMQLFERAGIPVVFAATDIDPSTPEGQLIHALAAYVANRENQDRTLKLVLAKKAAAREGRLPSGTALYGYRRVLEPAKNNPRKMIYARRVIDLEDEALPGLLKVEVIRRMHSWIVNDGMSVRGVVKQLREQGIPSPTGKPQWSKTQIHTLISNPNIYGIGKAFRYQRVQSSNGRDVVRIRPEAEWVDSPGNTEAIFAPEDYYRLKEAMKRHRQSPTAKAKGFYMLASPNRIKCWCGHRSYGETSKGTRRYRCSTRQHGSVKADGVEREVWEKVARVIMDPEELKARAREALEQDHEGLRLRHDLEKVEKEVEDLKETDQRAMELYLDKKYDKSRLDNILGKLRRRQKDAEILKKELKEKLNDRPHIAWEDAEEGVDRSLRWLSANGQDELQALLQETADVVGLDLGNEIPLLATEAAGSLASWKKNVLRVLDVQIELAQSDGIAVFCGVDLSLSP